MTRTLPSGPWHGHFMYADEVDVAHATSLTLEASGHALEGAGADADGPFTVEGVWDGARAQARWQKRYVDMGGVVVAYVGRWDDAHQELTGRWRVVNSPVHGRFALRPGDGGMFETTPRDARAFMRQRAAEWQSLCKVDLEALRFDGERAMLAHLLRDPDYVRTMQQAVLERDEAEGAMRRQSMSASRVRLRRAMAPGLFALLDRCQEALGLRAPVLLYVVNDGAVNARVVATRDNVISVTFTSAALNQLDPDELLYVLGHELGHALLGHLETPRVDDPSVGGLTCLRSFALQRYEELSADRVGLLCCRDVHTALRAEFVLTTGVVNRAVLGAPSAFLEHARRAVDELEAARGHAVHLGFDTHPYGEMRALAIELFSRSTTFRALVGAGGGDLDEPALERQVARLVRLMNPSIMEAGLQGTDALEFMLLGSLAVAATKGTSRTEANAIRRLGRGHDELVEGLTAMPLEEQQIRMIELAELLVAALPVADRAGIVNDVTLVARADGRISRAEREVLDGVAGLLGLDPEGVGDALAAAEAGLD